MSQAMPQSHYDCPCMEKCPLHHAMQLIGGKWKVQILCAVANAGAIRYNALRGKLDGISNTQTINPEALGHSEDERVENLVQVLDGYFDQGAHHLNVNVFGKEKLLDAMEHPEKEEYATFTIRVSGYAVKFIDLTKEQQLDVIARTCHKVL